MSADNWTSCPQCADNERTRRAKAEAEVAALYGKVSVVEFGKRQAELLKAPTPVEQTLREDYEFYGAETGVLKISYNCCCEACGLSFSHNNAIHFYPAK